MRPMFKPLPLFIASRYIKAKSSNRFISFISMTSILGLMLGVAVLIVVLSVMNGFGRELEVRILGMVPHGTLYGYEPIENWPEVVNALEQQPFVKGAAPLTEFQGMLTFQGSVAGAMINGIDPAQETKVSILGHFMETGTLDDLKPGEFNLIIGEILARQLGLTVGDKVTVVMPEATVSPAGIIPRFKRFTISGIFKVGAELDGLMAYIHWQDAARLMRQPDTISGIRLKFTDLFEAPYRTHQLKQEAAILADLPVYASDWTRTHGSLFKAIKMEKTMIALLLTLIVAVATFNIVSSLVMLVHDKKGDIAILRTMGASPQFIRRIFMLQGLMIGTLGITLGVLLGMAMALSISDLVAWIERVFHTELFGAYFINYLPSEPRLEDVIFITLAAFALSFLATLYPARKASLIPPAEALRYE